MQGVAHFLDGGVQPEIEIDEGIGAPEPLAQLVSCHELGRVLEQEGESLECLLAKLDLAALSEEFARTYLGFEDPETNTALRSARHQTRLERQSDHARELGAANTS